jgi:hypothetical protein
VKKSEQENLKLTERNVSVVIPNWNGKELLEKNLPPLIEALQYEKGKASSLSKIFTPG